ncbi:hypothetical protein DVH24_039135 [Malus domestica]|uniref:Uncharacterized protein n=1 Tax=Malus domestica TaxID=3750 RepID=A0A498KBR0_MALDO|nr:hypothetical protein DVH24_039135 [Malus domestica]
MSRPVLLVFLLLILIITSQFEWKQQVVPDLDTTPSISKKQNQNSNREVAVKEKVISLFPIHIILLQEKNIQRLNELVRSLRQQLVQCRSKNVTRNQTVSFLTEQVTELERHQIFDD